EGGAFRVVTEKDGLSGHSVQAFAEDPDGTVWAATNGGLTRFARGKMESFRSVPALSALLRVPSSLLVATYRDGLARLESAGRRPAGALRGAPVYSLAKGPDGAVWAATGKGLVRLDGERAEDAGLPGETVSAVLFDREGNLWAGTESGLYRLAGGRFEK